ncbi:MAG: hypothetical protein ACO23F_05765 [Candidatus Limnocylindrus sp.]
MTTDKSKETVPTLHIGEDDEGVLTKHVMLTDFEVSFDMEVNKAVQIWYCCIFQEPISSDLPAEEWLAERDRRLRNLQIPRKVAIGYAAKHKLLGNIHEAARVAMARYYDTFMYHAEKLLADTKKKHDEMF